MNSYSIARVYAILSLAFISILLGVACTSSSSDSDPAALNPVIKKTTRENYINGKKFCETYSKITSTEYGVYVPVPVNYDSPNAGTIEIYVYTLKPFDSQKPSYIYVDGGPGQNTHGLMPDYLDDSYNEIRFDQRGLGCSAPDTFDQYADPSLYSSKNNVRDMESIRKFFHIQNWSIYGVSYGTVPASLYGSTYSDSTISIVLEGVFGRPDQVHLASYKAEKLNLVLRDLSAPQRKAFTALAFENSAGAKAFFSWIFGHFYRDTGMRKVLSYLNKVISKDGEINRAELENNRARLEAEENEYPLPQQPGAVDENIMDIIYCKNLGSRDREVQVLDYSEELDVFFSRVSTNLKDQLDCEAIGVSRPSEEPFKIEDTRISKPVYYFQGSHDGATMAIGGIAHWKTVPTGASYFMLAQKGGHNPNLVRLHSVNSGLASAQKELFRLSITGAPIDQTHIDAFNLQIDPIQKWILYPDQNSARNIDEELKGIQNFSFAL